MASRLASPLSIPEEAEIDLFEIMTALADPVRRSIVAGIAAEPGRACNNADYGVSKSALTRHWRVLRESGVVRQEARGNRHHNWLRREELDRRFPGLLDLVLAEGARTDRRLTSVMTRPVDEPSAVPSYRRRPRPGPSSHSGSRVRSVRRDQTSLGTLADVCPISRPGKDRTTSV